MWQGLQGFLQGAMVDMVVVIGLFISTFVNGEAIELQEFVTAQIYVQMLKGEWEHLLKAVGNIEYLKRVLGEIEEFLGLPERERPPDKPLAISCASFLVPVGPAKPGDCKATTGHPTEILSEIDLSVDAGELIVVSGPNDAGKTSLLMAVAGELQRKGGAASLPAGILAFQPQDAPYDLFFGTIRDNVLFGAHDVNEVHLQMALSTSQLTVDFDAEDSTLHARREDTQVGDRGGALSGGQQQRTALARSVYAVLEGARVALLDDPVAALDNKQALAGWDQSILKAMAKAARVVVVNSQFLSRLGPSAHRVVLVEHGRITFNGLPTDIMADAALLQRLGKAYGMTQMPTKSARPRRSQAVARSVMDLALLPHPPLAPGAGGLQQCSEPLGTVGSTAGAADAEVVLRELMDFLASSTGMQNFLQETRPAAPLRRAITDLSPGPPSPLVLRRSATDGSPSRPCPLELAEWEWQTLRRLLRGLDESGGYSPQADSSQPPPSSVAVVGAFCRRTLLWTATSVVATVLAEGCAPAYTHLLAMMSEADGASLLYSPHLTFTIFALLVFGTSAFRAASAWADARSIDQLAIQLKTEIEDRVVSLSMPFHWHRGDAQTGHAAAEVLTVVTVDPASFEILTKVPVILAQALFGISAVVWAQPALLPLVLLTSIVMKRFNFVIRERLRCEQLLGAGPVLQAAAYQVGSLTTIRAMGREDYFHREIQCRLMTLWVFITHRLWGLIFLHENLCSQVGRLAFNGSAMACVIRIKTSGGDVATAVALYKIITMLNVHVWQFLQTSNSCEQAITQYDRCINFIATPHHEDPEAGRDAPKNWPPVKPAVNFEGVCFRYAPGLPLALRNVSITVEGGWKVGIVGPSGAGKSTLMNVLFRLGPLHNVPGPGWQSGGTVKIAGQDIASMKLSALRAAVGVVPQQPTIFAGSLQDNIGPAVTAEVAMDALRKVRLGKLATQASLLGPVDEAMSAGERQLLCTARALARQTRLLVLDECTKALDRKNSDLLLDTLTEQCGDVTVFSIAHRLRFVQHCDRILALQRGGLVDGFKPPQEWLQQSDSYFAIQLALEAERDKDQGEHEGG
eukprot:NODE_192_length_3434_cov_6.518899.p1 GENE.NODE_192_length_3434_cov_6.518899~~NODE_192_length_3434_cov_6.518899.p1  ORF type:complete len:1116 (+),score=195.46 NODE_192_length_3434_cov_6.518899:99-3350(+)